MENQDLIMESYNDKLAFNNEYDNGASVSTVHLVWLCNKRNTEAWRDSFTLMCLI